MIVLVFAPLALAVFGVTLAYLALRATERQRDEWKKMADKLAVVVQRVDPLDIVQVSTSERLSAGPRRIVLTGPPGDMAAWCSAASEALVAYGAMCEPEAPR